MTDQEILIVSEYIKENDLLTLVEWNTKRNWCGTGSRATWYNAIKKACSELRLAEYVMLLEAKQIMEQRQKEIAAEKVA